MYVTGNAKKLKNRKLSFQGPLTWVKNNLPKYSGPPEREGQYFEDHLSITWTRPVLSSTAATS